MDFNYRQSGSERSKQGRVYKKLETIRSGWGHRSPSAIYNWFFFSSKFIYINLRLAAIIDFTSSERNGSLYSRLFKLIQIKETRIICLNFCGLLSSSLFNVSVHVLSGFLQISVHLDNAQRDLNKTLYSIYGYRLFLFRWLGVIIRFLFYWVQVHAACWNNWTYN